MHQFAKPEDNVTPGFGGWFAPSHIMDYPSLADDVVVIAHCNEFKWPHGARSVRYLTNRKDALGRRWKWSSYDTNAMTFETKDQAYEWLVENDVVIHRDEVTTIGELKEKAGFPNTPWRRITSPASR